MRNKLYNVHFISELYRRTPWFFQNLMFTSYGILKAVNYFSPSVKEKIAYLEKSQWMTTDEIKEIQIKKLKNLITHAYKNVPYYHRVFKEKNLRPEDIKSFDDLEKIPLLTREIVAKEFDELVAKNSKDFSPRVYHTGGTTGKPLKFLMDKDMLQWREAEKYRYWRWHGYKFRDKMAILRGRVIVPEKRETKKPWRFDFTQNFLYLSSYHLNENMMDRYIELLKRWKPKYLQAYPSAGYILARHLLKKGETIKLKNVFTSSETLLPHFRKTMEEAFDCEVFDHYGHGEPGTWVSGECEGHSHHLSSEISYLEIFKNGEVLPVGEKGEIIDTCLTNYSMPFIRYKIGDIGSLSGEHCACGRGLPVIEHIEGRIEDYIVTPEGEWIPPPALTLTYEFILKIKQCQFVQESKDKVAIKIVKDEGYTEKDSKEFLKALRSTLGPKINIKFEFVDEIPLTKTGKFRFVISNIFSDDGN